MKKKIDKKQNPQLLKNKLLLLLLVVVEVVDNVDKIKVVTYLPTSK